MSASHIRLPRNETLLAAVRVGLLDPAGRQRWLEPHEPLSARSRYRSWLFVKLLRGKP